MAGRSPDQGFARKKEIWRIPRSLTLLEQEKAGESLRIWRTPLFWRIPIWRIPRFQRLRIGRWRIPIFWRIPHLANYYVPIGKLGRESSLMLLKVKRNQTKSLRQLYHNFQVFHCHTGSGLKFSQKSGNQSGFGDKSGCLQLRIVLLSNTVLAANKEH